ncbi:lysylphosphatidylglycerol synthase transmembrane domain-containing protein [Paenirhodobacter enshiensis]|uniref:lysylphosphatidylglycerol synthase transmembrane domain-containing protein n=1 Tax=Paenirhodobacter enshiensis TaxID=1105367 RepID=UPI00068DF8E7|nr:lysylphosphatidylglycerol synthase transmembrane domain-containing protein [Paenirhodobacter enshiensis]
MTPGKGLKLLIGTGVSVLFAWLVLRSVALEDLAVMLARVHPAWLGLALLAFGLDYACRVQRWKLMLETANPGIGWVRCAVPFMTSIAANNVLPFRAGDVLRAFGFARWLSISPASALATLLAERLMDLLILLCALSLAIEAARMSGAETAILPQVGSWGAGALALAVLLLLLAPGMIERPWNAVLALMNPRIPEIVARLRRQGDLLFGTLRGLSSGARMLRLLAWSVLAWSFEAGVFYAVARALPDMTVPTAAWLAMPVGTLSTLLPSTPGYVGTFHYFVTLTATTMGNDPAAAVAFAVLVHLALWLPASVIGAACFLYWLTVRQAHYEPAHSEKEI